MQKNIWIIGASTGIGEALAKQLVSEGNNIALSARSEDKLQELLPKLGDGSHLTSTLDVADAESIRQAMEDILTKWERIDSIIFMAGLYEPMPLKNINLEQTKQILEVNLMGAFNLIDAVLAYLLEQAEQTEKNNRPQLALCASVAGYMGLPKSQPYGASKAGLINLAESLHSEHSKQIDVKLINPGFVKSRLTDKNDFKMPMCISAEEAAKHISKGLKKKGFEIHFPKAFTYMLKFIRILPYWISSKIV